MPLIREPRRLNPLLRVGIALSERVTGRRMEPARLLAWYPRAAIGSGVLESLVSHREPSARLLKLVRVTASLTASCAFCIDMNSFRAAEAGVSADELTALQRGTEDDIVTLTERERTAIAYARAISSTPLVFDDDLTAALSRHFTEREIVILATTAAQVNYWARTIQALGIQPAGFCTSPGARR
ncbi:MAG: carboxymuconolactone decarboxylase family protein [Actinobacteria bacterium]|nr:carboxymuconolactone decarboxylase family protein [Actinomycetota bacterium]